MRFSAVSTADRLLPEGIAARARPILDRVDAVIFTGDERGQAGRTSLVAFAIRIVSAVIALASQVLMARWMGSFEYGLFVLVWTTMIIVGNLSCFGFNTSIIRYIPEYRALGRLADLRGVMATSRLFVLATSSLITGLGLCGVWYFSAAFENYYIVPFYLGIVCLPMIALSDTLEGTARANSWAMLALGPIYLLRPILILLLMGIALASGYEPDAQTALGAAILATFLTTLFQLFAVLPATGREVRKIRPVFRLREWLVVSLPIFLIEGFAFMLTNADVLIVGWYLEPNEVGVYFATVKILALVHFVYFAVKAGVAQRYAQYAHGDNRHELAAFARETVLWTFWPSVAMGLAVLLIGKPMLMLFGPEFAAGYPLLFVLVLGVVARACVGPAESLLTMSGNQNACAVVYGLTLGFNIVLNVLLIPAYGLWGAAIAMAAALACEAALLAFTVWRQLGFVMVVPLGRKPAVEIN
ncbi:lipopolysaccharide biosynthesis protein [Mesorhizobium sp. CAU 1741]|uniref:lipopolysaccharide biosynthesis protein n=1 Tax=Mesorhizobium sp. CAU 1741 TaxID=3140366 RepID=UPI00325B4379